MNLTSIKTLGIIGAVTLIAALTFQNCSPVAVTDLSDAESEKVSGLDGEQPPDTNLEEPENSCRMISKSEVATSGDAYLVPCVNGSDVQCALVCHVPPGNHSAKHNVIIGLAARFGPHQPGGHGGDYDGPCSDGEETFEACVE